MPIGSLYGRVEGLGMNERELQSNRQLTGYVCADLNKDPRLPYDDASFDAVTCVVSVDYLTKPLEVFREIHRVLRPGGQCLMSFSNRCFPTKAVAMWLQADDIGRMTIVGSYAHYAAAWQSIEALDIKLRGADAPGAAGPPPRKACAKAAEVDKLIYMRAGAGLAYYGKDGAPHDFGPYHSDYHSEHEAPSQAAALPPRSWAAVARVATKGPAPTAPAA